MTKRKNMNQNWKSKFCVFTSKKDALRVAWPRNMALTNEQQRTDLNNIAKNANLIHNLKNKRMLLEKTNV